MFEALDVIRPIQSTEHLTVISCERGVEPNKYYCIDGNGNGDWFEENEITIAKINDVKNLKK